MEFVVDTIYMKYIQQLLYINSQLIWLSKIKQPNSKLVQNGSIRLQLLTDSVYFHQLWAVVCDEQRQSFVA
jgi:hypothetical protein